MVDDKNGERNFDSPEDFEDFMTDESNEGSKDEEEAVADKDEEMPEDEELEMPEEEKERPEDMLDIAADVPVQVVAVMGKRNITLKEIASLKMGEVIELNRPANEIVDLVAGGKLIARGELVEIEGKMGVRIVKMMR